MHKTIFCSFPCHIIFNFIFPYKQEIHITVFFWLKNFPSGNFFVLSFLCFPSVCRCDAHSFSHSWIPILSISSKFVSKFSAHLPLLSDVLPVPGDDGLYPARVLGDPHEHVREAGLGTARTETLDFVDWKWDERDHWLTWWSPPDTTGRPGDFNDTLVDQEMSWVTYLEIALQWTSTIALELS